MEAFKANIVETIRVNVAETLKAEITAAINAQLANIYIPSSGRPSYASIA
jgi:hypothetical protein